MDKSLKITEDGSYTVFSSSYGETYHSIYGAETESLKIFIDYGLDFFIKNNKSNLIRIFEVGFGTGLNAFLTNKFPKDNILIEYNTVEISPLKEDIYSAIADNFYNSDDRDMFLSLHCSKWNELVQINDSFSIKKFKASIFDIETPSDIDIVYFDAFSPNVQPELWTLEVFKSLFDKMNKGGIITTYCAKGQVRRNMQEAGFVVERLEGPPHKREVLRGIKQNSN